MTVNNKKVVKVLPLDKVFAKLTKKLIKLYIKHTKAGGDLAISDNKVVKYLYINKIIKLLDKETQRPVNSVYKVSHLVVSQETYKTLCDYDKLVLFLMQPYKYKETIDKEYAWYDLNTGLTVIKDDNIEDGMLYVLEGYITKKENAD